MIPKRTVKFVVLSVIGTAVLTGCSPVPPADGQGSREPTPTSSPGIPHGVIGAAHFDELALVVGDGPIDVQVWIDPLCPDCRAFETAAGPMIAALVDSDTITYSVHLMNFLDRASAGSRYSSRAGSALTCVAAQQPDALLESLQAIFDAQPEEGTTGLSDEAIIDTLAVSGADGLESCVAAETYTPWVQLSNDSAIDGITGADVAAITGTPTMIVDGTSYTGDVTDLPMMKAFILSAAP